MDDNFIAMGVTLNVSDDFRKSPMVETARTLLANKSNCGGGVIMAEMDKKYSVVKLPHGYFNGEVKEAEYSPTIDTGVGNWHTLIGEGNVSHCECVVLLGGDNFDGAFESTRRVYSAEHAAPTITTCGGGQREVKICEPIAIDEQNGQFRLDGTVGTIVTDGNSPKHNNRGCEPIIYDDYNGRVRADQSAVGALTTNCGNDAPRNGVKLIEPSMKIRKLTEKECWRLMGVKDEDFEKVRKNQSMSSLYHLAGDSIITNCLMAIFKEMF